MKSAYFCFMLQIKSFSNHAVLPYLDALAELRLEVFREFPYLYDGDRQWEQAYLNQLATATDTVIVVAFDGDKIVGASTGLPMRHESFEVQKPFLEGGHDISTIFYFGESVLKKAYRGKGMGVEFFKHREAHARRLNQFETLTFCSVMRTTDHLLCPKDYVPLDDFWRKRGFEPTKLICYLTWKEVEEAEGSAKPLRFWTKEIF